MRTKARAPGSPLRRVLLGGAAALLLVFYLARAASEAASRSPVFFVDPGRTVVEEAPAWIPVEWLAEAREALAGLAPYSIFDGEGEASAEMALRSLGWALEVSTVERTFPRAARLRIRVRRPAAVVAGAGGERLVDETATVLPSLPPERAALLPSLPRILVSRGDLGPGPPAGERWRDRRVAAGVAAAREVPGLVRREGPTRVVAIDVTHADGRSDPLRSPIVLVTASGARLLWGRPAALRAFGELAPAVKLAALARVEAEYPGLEGIREADLRFDRPVVLAEAARLAVAR